MIQKLQPPAEKKMKRQETAARRNLVDLPKPLLCIIGTFLSARVSCSGFRCTCKYLCAISKEPHCKCPVVRGDKLGAILSHLTPLTQVLNLTKFGEASPLEDSLIHHHLAANVIPESSSRSLPFLTSLSTVWSLFTCNRALFSCQMPRLRKLRIDIEKSLRPLAAATGASTLLRAFAPPPSLERLNTDILDETIVNAWLSASSASSSTTESDTARWPHNMRQLWLGSECRISATQLDRLLAQMPLLTQLSIFAPHIINSFQRKGLVLRVANLREIELARFAGDPRNLDCLGTLKQLTSINLSHSSCDDKTLKRLARLPQLASLDLNGCYRLTPAGFARFGFERAASRQLPLLRLALPRGPPVPLLEVVLPAGHIKLLLFGMHAADHWEETIVDVLGQILTRHGLLYRHAFDGDTLTLMRCDCDARTNWLCKCC